MMRTAGHEDSSTITQTVSVRQGSQVAAGGGNGLADTAEINVTHRYTRGPESELDRSLTSSTTTRDGVYGVTTKRDGI